MDELLRYSLKYSTGAKVDPERVKENRHIIESIVFNDELKEALELLEKSPKEGLVLLKEILEDLNYAESFLSRGGFESAFRYLDTEFDELVFDLVAAASQNYTKIQHFLLPRLSEFMNPAKAYGYKAVLSLVGTDPKCVAEFISKDGASYLKRCISQSKEQANRCVKYVVTLLHNYPLDFDSLRESISSSLCDQSLKEEALNEIEKSRSSKKTENTSLGL